MQNASVLFRTLLLFSLLIPFVSCETVFKKEPTETWIGGQIINPRGKNVLIIKDGKVVDSAQLDKDAFFMIKLDSVDEGIYSFYHHEYQVFYLEPGDSLMLRVNTVDFDESLTYTGHGADRNNLLMDFFLMNEKENMLIPSYYRLAPGAYEQKIDSLRKNRHALYDRYLENNSACKGFEEVALGNINYDFYSKKELYTSVHASNPNVDAADFPDSFYAYRDSVDLSNIHLRAYFPYYRFLNRYFDNLAFDAYRENEELLNRNSYTHNLHKIRIIDSMVGCTVLKNNLLRTSAKRYLIHGKDAANEEHIVEMFSKLNTDKEHHREINELAQATLQLTPGKLLPSIQLVDFENQTHGIHDVIQRSTVLYFWSGQSAQNSRNLHARAAELKAKYPEYDFKGINTDNNFRGWQRLLAKSGFDHDQEFQIENLDDARKKLLINSVNKAIILSDKGVILDANTNLFSPDFEDSLLGYLNM